MLENKKGCSCQDCPKNELLKNLLRYDWSEDGPEIRRTLFKLLQIYLCSDVCDVANIETRRQVAYDMIQVYETVEILENHALANPEF